MTPGCVNLKIVSDRVALARGYLADLEALKVPGAEVFASDRRNPAAAESFLRRAIEALFDAARHLLAKGHGLAGLEYREVARLACERGLVADPALAPRLVKVAGFRNRLTHFYERAGRAGLGLSPRSGSTRRVLDGIWTSRCVGRSSDAHAWYPVLVHRPAQHHHQRCGAPRRVPMPLQDAGEHGLHLAQVLSLVEDDVGLRLRANCVERGEQICEAAVLRVGERRVPRGMAIQT